MHLCAQEDKHQVATVLDNYHADINPETKVIIIYSELVIYFNTINASYIVIFQFK